MVNLQYLHWRLGSDILSKWNFPVVLNTFYLISMLAVWIVTTYCHSDRWAKAQESNIVGFSNESCLVNVKIYFCPGFLVHTQAGINGTRSKLWNGTSCRLKYRAAVKNASYVFIYTHIIKNSTKGHTLQIYIYIFLFYCVSLRLMRHWEQ